jgi:hypothetical protein
MRSMQGVLLTLVLFLSVGCVAVSRKVETSEELRLPITFENAEAARLFYSSMNRPKPYMSDQSFFMAFPFAIGVEWVLHETEWYNHLVRRADIDHDGLLSEAEARVLVRQQEEEGDEETLAFP